MMERRLRRKLGRLESMFRGRRLWRRLALCWFVTGIVALALLLFRTVAYWNSALVWALPLTLAIVGGGIIWIQERRRPADLRTVVNAIEREDPEVRHLLSAAAE